MTATLNPLTEMAGANAAGHIAYFYVKFTGGHADVFSGNAAAGHTEKYQWQYFSTYQPGAKAVRYGTSTTTELSDGGTVVNGDSVTFTYPISTTSSAAFKGILTGRCVTEDWGTDQFGVVTSIKHISYQEITFDPYRVRQFPLEVASVDSRTTYAPPNKDGAYPAADANADKRNVAFAGWSYRGGLFVGNAASINGDQSGIGRIQCQADNPGDVANSIYTLTLLHIGTPSFFKSASTQWDGPMSLLAEIAGPNPTVPISSLTWETALQPSTFLPGSQGTNFPANEYVNLFLNIGTTFPSRILVHAADETVPRWRYFGGSTYAPPSPVYPYSECKPHLWATYLPNWTGISYNNISAPGTGYPNYPLWVNVAETQGGGTNPGGGGGTNPTNPTEPTTPGTPEVPGTPGTLSVKKKAPVKPAVKPKPKAKAPAKKAPVKKKGGAR